MLRKLALALAALVVGTSGLALTAGSASANPGSPKCMTKAEWRRVQPGMSRATVKQITGIWGRAGYGSESADGDVDQTYEYRQCKSNGKPAGSWNTVSVNFVNYVDNPNYWTDDDDWDLYLRAPMHVESKGSWYRVW